MSACASIIDGSTQQIAIESTPPGAQCDFSRQGTVIGQTMTPGGVVVQKTKHNIQVSCQKEGYETTTATLKSGVAGATWGNIILGGGIGWAIDSASGSDNKYEEFVSVSMVPKIAAPGSAPATAASAAVAPATTPPPATTASTATTPATSGPQPSSQLAAAAQRWRTVGGSAPGFDQPDVKSRSTAILSTTDLKYVDQKGDWMQFEYAAADGTRPRVWLNKANVSQGDTVPSTGTVITFRKETGASVATYGQPDVGGNPRCPTC
ncbi:MAG: hypothetical protein AB7M05_16815 [Alphaproteobacteria bacterium]